MEHGPLSLYKRIEQEGIGNSQLPHSYQATFNMQFSVGIALLAFSLSQVNAGLFSKKPTASPINTIGGPSLSTAFVPEHLPNIRFDQGNTMSGPGQEIGIMRETIYSNPCYHIETKLKYVTDKNDKTKVIIAVEKKDKQNRDLEKCNPNSFPFKHLVGNVEVKVAGDDDVLFSLPLNVDVSQSNKVYVSEKALKKSLFKYNIIVATVDVFDPAASAFRIPASYKLAQMPSSPAVPFNPSEKKGSDVVFKFPEEFGTPKVYAHHSVVDSVEYFSTLANWEKEHDNSNTLTIVDFQASTIKAMLEYIYTKSISKHTPKDWAELIQAADFYGLPELQAYALSKMLSTSVEKNEKLWKDATFDDESPFKALAKLMGNTLPTKFTRSEKNAEEYDIYRNE
jgi:hypothetical protein